MYLSSTSIAHTCGIVEVHHQRINRYPSRQVVLEAEAPKAVAKVAYVLYEGWNDCSGCVTSLKGLWDASSTNSWMKQMREPNISEQREFYEGENPLFALYGYRKRGISLA